MTTSGTSPRRVPRWAHAVGTLVAITAMLVFNGCASFSSVPKASSERDLAAKYSILAPDLVRVYVYRLGAHPLVRYTSGISLDGDGLGSIGRHRYVVADIAPGAHRVVASTIMKKGGRFLASSELSFNAAAGEIVFIRVEVPTFWPVDPPTLLRVEQHEGAKALAECSLIREASSPVR